MNKEKTIEKILNFIEGFLILLPFLIAGMGDSFM